MSKYFAILGLREPPPEGRPALQNIPPLTPEIEKQLRESRGFEVLISYTDRGFEPLEATIQKGESIRFTNNSSSGLWVASMGNDAGPQYPGTSNCGASRLDTCNALEPLEFWEFTFNEAGDWAFRNNVTQEHVGVILVE